MPYLLFYLSSKYTGDYKIPFKEYYSVQYNYFDGIKIMIYFSLPIEVQCELDGEQKKSTEKKKKKSKPRKKKIG